MTRNRAMLLIVTGASFMSFVGLLMRLLETTDGMLISTPAYMSPEQCMGRLVDERGSLSVSWPKERCRTAKEELALFPEVSAT